MTQEELNKLLDSHERWLKDVKTGNKLFLAQEDLRGLSFVNRDLAGADFFGCFLDNADFKGAIFAHKRPSVKITNFRGGSYTEVHGLSFWVDHDLACIDKDDYLYYSTMVDNEVYHCWNIFSVPDNELSEFMDDMGARSQFRLLKIASKAVQQLKNEHYED